MPSYSTQKPSASALSHQDIYNHMYGSQLQSGVGGSYLTPEQISSLIEQAKKALKVPNIEETTWRAEILRLRMRWASNAGPLQSLSTHYLKSTDKVVLFLIHKDEPIVLHDDGPLFPSDALITQLRLLTTE